MNWNDPYDYYLSGLRSLKANQTFVYLAKDNSTQAISRENLRCNACGYEVRLGCLHIATLPERKQKFGNFYWLGVVEDLGLGGERKLSTANGTAKIARLWISFFLRLRKVKKKTKTMKTTRKRLKRNGKGRKNSFFCLCFYFYSCNWEFWKTIKYVEYKRVWKEINNNLQNPPLRRGQMGAKI